MNNITKDLLKIVSDWDGTFKGAYNIREDGGCAGRQSSENIKIETKLNKPGIDIFINANTKNESVYIPACVTKGDVNDLVYNDFYVGENADITIVAGCGVHTESHEDARHNGIHRFFLSQNSRVKYIEKHIGTGSGDGKKKIEPVTEAFLKENAILEMDTSQLSGVDYTHRETKVTMDKNSKLIIKERLLTSGDEKAETVFYVEMNGDGSSADVISRSVAKGNSYQSYQSTIIGNASCMGHTECDAIIDGNGKVDATPRLFAHNGDAQLIHEAAIGKIAGEQILKLETLGLTQTEAEAKIIDGFLK